MNEYKIPPEGLAAARSRMLRRLAAVYCVYFIIIIGIIGYQTRDIGLEIWWIYPVVIAVLGVSTYFATRRIVRRNMQYLRTYNLMLTSNLISREGDNFPTIAIYLKDIRSIQVTKRGVIVIKSPDRHATIAIPREIERYDEIRETLNQIMPVTEGANGGFRQGYRLLLLLVFLASMAGFIMSDTRWIFTVSGIICVGALGWSWFEIRRSRNVDERIKRRSWTYFLFVALIIYLLLVKWGVLRP